MLRLNISYKWCEDEQTDKKIAKWPKIQPENTKTECYEAFWY